MFLIPFSLLVIATLLGGFGAVYLKKASVNFNLSFTQVKNVNLWFGIFYYGISTVLFLIALKFGELSIIYPLVSMSYVWVAILSMVKLNERLNKYKIAGISLIMLGVVFLGLAA